MAAAWVAPQLRTPEARDLFASFASMTPADRAAHLREEAAGAGLSGCMLAELWAAPPPPSPYVRDIGTICETSSHVGPSADPAAQATAAAGWLRANLSDPRAIDFFGSLADMDPEQRVTALRDEATLAGLAACPYADWMEQQTP